MFYGVYKRDSSKTHALKSERLGGIGTAVQVQTLLDTRPLIAYVLVGVALPDYSHSLLVYYIII